MKHIYKMLAVLFASSAVTGSAAAFDFEQIPDLHTVQFKKELIYTMSKTDALYRRFLSEGLTESILSYLYQDENVLYVVQTEMRYENLWVAVQSAKSEVSDDAVDMDSDTPQELTEEEDEQ